MHSDEVMNLTRAKGRVKSLDSDADGSCSRNSQIGLTEIILQQTFSRGNRDKN